MGQAYRASTQLTISHPKDETRDTLHEYRRPTANDHRLRVTPQLPC